MLRFITMLVLYLSGTLFGQHAGGFRFINEGMRSITLPIEVHNNLILVDVTINGSFPFKFILDTGVKTSLLTEPALMGFMSLQDSKPIRVLGLGEGEVIQARLVKDLYMRIGDVAGKDLRMIILPEGTVSYSGMFGKPVVGIIGYDFFQNFIVEINYQRKYIKLHDPARYKPRKRDVAIPLELYNRKPYVNATIMDHRGSEVITKWLIDTGASTAISIYHEEIETPDETLQAFIGRGLSGDMFGKIGRVQRLEIGDYAFEGVVAGYPDTASIRWVIKSDTSYANLGAEILSRFDVIFDYTHYKLYLRKSSRFSKPFLYNTSGIEAIAEPPKFNKYEIVYVRPSSPAETADIRVGDQIISINGVDVSTLDIGDLHSILNREPGKRVRLRIRRNGERIRKIFYIEGEI